MNAPDLVCVGGSILRFRIVFKPDAQEFTQAMQRFVPRGPGSPAEMTEMQKRRPAMASSLASGTSIRSDHSTGCGTDLDKLVPAPVEGVSTKGHGIRGREISRIVPYGVPFGMHMVVGGVGATHASPLRSSAGEKKSRRKERGLPGLRAGAEGVRDGDEDREHR